MAKFNRAFFSDMFSLMKGFWSPGIHWTMFLLAAVILGLQAYYVSVMVDYNSWQRMFYDTIQAMDADSFFFYLQYWPRYMVAFIAMEAGRGYLVQYLEIRWRTWLINDFIHRWLGGKTYYLMQIDEEFYADDKGAVDNPDQRITDDIRLFVSYFLSLTLGIFNAVLRISSFGVVLWGLSGVVEIPVGEHRFTVVGYMVWLAIGYALIGTLATLWAGRPIVKLNNQQQEYEADLRFGFARLREYFESIAFYNGERSEREGAVDRFNVVRRNFLRLMRRRFELTWVTELHWRIGFLFPYMVAVPKIFSGEMQYGGLMQTAVAFQQVVNSLSFLVLRYYSPTEASISQMQAVVHRLTDFRKHMDKVDSIMDKSGIVYNHAGDNMVVDKLNVNQPDGCELVKKLSLELSKGDSLLIEGRSGIGKSTLLRALAGIWPYGEGTITMPAGERTIFIPQKNYLPMGTLRTAILYPFSELSVSDEEIIAGLNSVNLEKLIPHLDRVENWSQVLSVGEQERLAFLKIILIKPSWIFLDEATAALDEGSEDDMYTLLREKMPMATVISIAHRRRVAHFHVKSLLLKGSGEWELMNAGES